MSIVSLLIMEKEYQKKNYKKYSQHLIICKVQMKD
jgi:hypothetical protein